MTLNRQAKNSLGQRTVSGSLWLFSSRATSLLVTLIQVTILARLIDPEAFGLMGLALLASQAIGVFIYTGYEFALVQKVELHQVDIHTAWWVMLGRRVIIGLCLMLLAFPIAHFYQAPDAVPILIAFAFVQPIQGLASMSPILFRREMQFRKVFELNFFSALTGLVVGVIAAVTLRSVWALVLASFATTVIHVILSYWLHPYRPRWCFSLTIFRQLSNYGLWMLGSAILWFIFSQGSSAFSGWMFGVAALGLFQMAGRFALLPSTQLGEVIQSALMPAYALIQDDRKRVSRTFLKTLSLAAMLIMGMTALIAFGLPRLLITLLGDQWVQAAALVPALAIAGGGRAMLRLGSPLYLGTGRPQFQFFMDLAQTVTMVILLYPLGKLFGLSGLPFATLGGVLIALPIWWMGVHKSTTCTLIDVSSVLGPAIIGMVVITIVFFIGQLPAISRMDSVLGLIWNITLILIASVGFMATIIICQRLVPHYSPLVELQNIFNQMRQRSHLLKMSS